MSSIVIVKMVNFTKIFDSLPISSSKNLFYPLIFKLLLKHFNIVAFFSSFVVMCNFYVSFVNGFSCEF